MTLKNSISITFLALLLVSLFSFPFAYAIDACEKNPNYKIRLNFPSTYKPQGIISNPLQGRVAFPISAVEDSTIQIPVTICNDGTDPAAFYTEVGIYAQGSRPAVPLSLVPFSFTVRNANNCVPGEKNVDRGLIELSGGTCGTALYKLIVPKFDSSRRFQVQAVAFDSCFAACSKATTYTYIAKSFQILDSPHKVSDPTCSDGIQNQDESDTDCGGVCKNCGFNYACNSNSDCGGSNSCVNERCSTGETIANNPSQIPLNDATQDEISQLRKASTGDFLIVGGIIGAVGTGAWLLFGRRRR